MDKGKPLYYSQWCGQWMYSVTWCAEQPRQAPGPKDNSFCAGSTPLCLQHSPISQVPSPVSKYSHSGSFIKRARILNALSWSCRPSPPWERLIIQEELGARSKSASALPWILRFQVTGMRMWKARFYICQGQEADRDDRLNRWKKQKPRKSNRKAQRT